MQGISIERGDGGGLVVGRGRVLDDVSHPSIRKITDVEPHGSEFPSAGTSSVSSSTSQNRKPPKRS